MRGFAVDLVAEVRQLDRRNVKAASDIEPVVVESSSSLTGLCGQDPHPHPLDRPVPLDCCARQLYQYRTHRLPPVTLSGTGSRGPGTGDRQPNCVLQTMAITQIGRETSGRTYYRRKRAA